VPQFAIQRVPEHKVVKLVQTRWHEHVLQKHLYTHDAVERRGIWPALQRQLCETTLQRAKLEVDLYNQALFGDPGGADSCKLCCTSAVTLLLTAGTADLHHSFSHSCSLSVSPIPDYADSADSDCESDLDLEECEA
jgi:hypothetical protein